MITNHVGFYYRGTTAERTALSPQRSSVFFDTDTGDVYSWDGSAWQRINLDTHDHSAAGEGGQDLRDLLEFQFAAATELTIAAGVITRTQTYHTVDTASDDATDDLDTINGGTAGDMLIIRPAHTDRSVVVKDGTGNIVLQGGADITLDDATDHLILVYDGSNWNDFGGGGGGGGASTWLDLTDTPAAFVASRFVAVNGAADALELVEGAACTFETTTVEVAGWEELDRDTLTGSQGTIDFQNISQDYEDLMLVCRLRSDRAGQTNDQLLMYFNNDAVNANYFSDYIREYNAAVSSIESDGRGIAHAPGATGLAGCFCYTTIMIPRYAESELHHSHSRSVVRLTAAINLDGIWSHHWETADPITRVTLDQTSGPNFIAGSEAVLYGRRTRDLVTAVTGQVVVTGNTVAKVATVTGIDATAVAATTLYTVPAGNTFIPDHVVIRVTAFTDGGKAVQAVASFGGNAATYDDYLNSVTYTIAAADVFIRDSVEDTAAAIQAAADVFKIAIETGSDATTETWAVDLFGYLV